MPAPIPASRTRSLAPLAILTLAATAEVFRLGFFADDFHFLDAARRAPLLGRLLGQYSLLPWYRPLSREVYFSALALAGPLGPHLAHALNVAALLAAATALWVIARRLLDRRSAAVACALFVTWSYTKFLASWASGFQDLLAIALVLWAFCGYLLRRPGLMLTCAALAPFAKETGFLVLPLVASYAAIGEGERRVRGSMRALLLVTLAALAIQAAVRITWRATPAMAPVALPEPSFVQPLIGALRGFLPAAPVPALLPALLAGLAAAASWALVRDADGEASARPPRPAAFLVLALALNLAPMVVVSLRRLSQPYDYYAFSAVPWFALLVARWTRGVATRAVRVVLGLLVAANVWGLGRPAIDLDRDQGWQHHGWDWYDACRLSAVSDRFRSDLGQALSARAESTIVLYTHLPVGSWFQTEDGPATREALRDPTVRAYFISLAPMPLPADRLAIVDFDTEHYHLKLAGRDDEGNVVNALEALALGSGRAGYALAANFRPGDRQRRDIAYLRSVAALMVLGVPGYRDELSGGGLNDSLARRPEGSAPMFVPDLPGLASAYAGVLARPLTSQAHAACAESLMLHQATIAAIVEYRVCVLLSPDRFEQRWRLGGALEQAEAYRQARDVYREILGARAPAAIEQRAREALTRLDSRVKSGSP